MERPRRRMMTPTASFVENFDFFRSDFKGLHAQKLDG
jgi:hypothetical protein